MMVFYKAFYKAMFMWRGFSVYITVPPFLTTLKNAIMDIFGMVSIAMGIVEYMLYPVGVI